MPSMKKIQGRLTFLKDTVAQSRAEFAIMAAEASTSRTRTTQAGTGGPSDDRSSNKLESGGQTNEEYPDEKETPLIERRKSSHSPKQLWARASAVVQSATLVATSGHHRNSSITQPLRESMAATEGGEYELPGENKDMKNKLSPEDRARLLREADSTQRALVDLYRTAKLLHNFAILNFTGFVKIVKKFNKTLPQHKGRFKQATKPENVCDEGKAVEALADRMVVLYANWFCQGSKSEAQVQIMPKKGDSLEMDWTQLRVGYRMGMCTILGLWVAWDCIWGMISKGRSTIGERDAFPVFRACGGLLLLQWFWGVSVWVWTRFRINYIYLFDFNPHIVDSPMAIFNAAVDHTLFYLINMLLYYKAGTHDIPGKFPQGVFPFFLVVYACLQLVIPVRTRLPMWGSIWRVVTAPAYSPSFFQGYIGDIFTSMVKVFQDMAWTAFFIFSGDWMVSEDSSADANAHHWSKTTGYKNILIPLLTLLPLWFRFNQCLRRYLDTRKRFPHLANAFKYALSQTVTLFGAFHPLYLDHTNQRTDMAFYQRWWMLLFIGSSLYSFTWDVYMDWGLGLPKFNMLGPRLMFPNRAIYYAIISADLVLRFAWVLTLIPPGTGAKFALPNYLAAVSMILELGRRTVWGFLRLENEHRSNTAGYRRVNFVPLHFTTGHKHDYSHGKEHRGIRVLLEVAFVTLAVLAACVWSVVAAQHATDLSKNEL
jgi:EXS family/SPX domain